VVQDQFAYLWANHRRLSVKSYPDYLFTAVKNKCTNYLKSSYHKRKASLSEAPERLYAIPYTEQQVNYSELSWLIQEAISLLPPRCSTIYYLKRYEELSNKAIAERLSLSEKTIENQMTIAIRKITSYLRNYWGEFSLILVTLALAG
jgi:RNA polymerase sigma factor (sigma-70 family)